MPDHNGRVRRTLASLPWCRFRLGLVTLTAASFVASRMLRRVEVEGSSMAPSLTAGDRLLLRRRLGGTLELGDIVGFRDPRPGGSQLMVKRVAHIDGDLVTVLGDNASLSTDSRTFGPVDRRQIPWVMVRRYARVATR